MSDSTVFDPPLFQCLMRLQLEFLIVGQEARTVFAKKVGQRRLSITPCLHPDDETAVTLLLNSLCIASLIPLSFSDINMVNEFLSDQLR